jgi:hypothetical protein
VERLPVAVLQSRARQRMLAARCSFPSCLCLTRAKININKKICYFNMHTKRQCLQVSRLFDHAPGTPLHNRVHASSLLHIWCMSALVSCTLDVTSRWVWGDKRCKRSKQRASQGTHNVARGASRKPIRRLPEYKPHRVKQSQIREAENLWREGKFKEAETIFGTFVSLPRVTTVEDVTSQPACITKQLHLTNITISPQQFRKSPRAERR